MRRKIGATDRIVVGGKSSTVGEYLAAHPGPRRQVLRGLLGALKAGHAKIAWDESKHPRDDHGRFADKPNKDTGAAPDQGRWSSGGGWSELEGETGEPFQQTVVHASPNPSLAVVLATPPARQFDNATSALGAFFSIHPDERYGPNVYAADLHLKKPYVMPWSEFSYLQSPNKGRDGNALPSEKWAARAEELKIEARVLRENLSRLGHDGILIKSRGTVREIVSFADVAVRKA